MNQLIIQSDNTPADYKELFPLMVFDVSKQSERLKSLSTFNVAVPAGTEAFAVVVEC